mgnify:CR=1 FL=1
MPGEPEFIHISSRTWDQWIAFAFYRLYHDFFASFWFYFVPFYSKSADACGYKWAYTISFNEKADLGGKEGTVADFVRLVVDDSNATQLEITAPTFAIA